MDLQEAQSRLAVWLDKATLAFHKVPGSAVLVRYIQSSYQNDPIRSAIELVLVIFFIRYLLSPSYYTHKQNFIKLREDVSLSLLSNRSPPLALTIPQEVDELVEEWVPEPLVAPQTALEEAESEKLPVIVG